MKGLIVLLLLSFSSIYSQNYIFDIKSNKPIESVNISYGKEKGLITNVDGLFFLEDSKYVDTIKISHLSYNTKILNFNNLKKNDTIFLKKIAFDLEEVLVTSVNPKKIIMKAINRIKDNYLNIDFNQFGFLRRTIEEDGKGIEMIEVAFTNYYDKSQFLNTKLTNAKRTKNYAKIDLDVRGGVFSIIEKGDFVKREKLFLNMKNINNYTYAYQGKINHNDLEVYKIEILFKENRLKNYRKSYVYIDVKSYAFVKIENYFDDKKLQALEEENLKKMSRRKKRKTLYLLRGGHNAISYKKLKNNRWALSNLSVTNKFKVSNKKESHMYDINASLVINNILYDKVVPVKTNYNVSKDFYKAIKRIKNVAVWNDNYKFSLSKKDKRILKEINLNSKIQ